MSMFTGDWLHQTLMLLPVLLLSLTVHEFAHARTALAFGDRTAFLMGRVTLNPLRHLDLIGTLMLIFSGFIGWAKPVPVNPYNLQPRRLGQIAVSGAGVCANLLIALLCGCLLRILVVAAPNAHGDGPLGVAETILLAGLVINVGLFVFNLLPLYPLDGHHILRELLPLRLQEPFMYWQVRFGQFALMALIVGPRLLGNGQIPDPIYMARDTVTRLVVRLVFLS